MAESASTVNRQDPPPPRSSRMACSLSAPSLLNLKHSHSSLLHRKKSKTRFSTPYINCSYPPSKFLFFSSSIAQFRHPLSKNLNSLSCGTTASKVTIWIKTICHFCWFSVINSNCVELLYIFLDRFGLLLGEKQNHLVLTQHIKKPFLGLLLFSRTPRWFQE